MLKIGPLPKMVQHPTGYCLVENKKNITIISNQCLFFIIHTKLQLGIQILFLKPK